MKLYYAFFIFFFSFCIVQAQTTTILDANFEQELITQGIDTNGLNGNILDTDAQAITTLALNGTAITDITGINAFVNITNLDLGTNLVVNIAPTALSVLTDFATDENTALTSVDFSQNTALENVFIEGDFPVAPPLTTIDLSQNLNLVSFKGDFLDNVNDIIFPVTNTLIDIDVRYLSDTTFDLSLLSGLEDLRIGGWRGNTTITLPNVFTNLKNLRISSIDIPTIDISGYINLESIYFWGTYVENLLLPNSNTLTNIFIILHDIQNVLDLSVLPNLTDLYISSNSGTPLVIDLTQNLVLEDVTLNNNDMNSIDLTQNILLEDLELNNNNLTTLDVTQNILLNRFSARNNQLPGIDLTQNVVLRYLTLSFNLITVLDVTQNIDLRSIYIDNNLFTTTGLDLTQNIELSTIYAGYNQIESLDITQNENLYSLNIEHNIFPGNAILNQYYTLLNTRGRLGGILIANNNLLTGLVPDFYGLYNPTIQTRRFQLYINENRFHFGDFEDQHLGFVDLTTTMSIGPAPDWVIQYYLYAPQAKVNAIETFNINAGDAITLTTIVRGTQNHYTWFKDGIAIPGAPDSPNYTITSANSCDEAVYHSEITSDLVPFENGDPPGTDGKNLLLIRNDITLNITSPTESCTSLTSPINGSSNIPINEVLTWAESLGACGYFISIGTTSGGTDILNNQDVGNVTDYTTATSLPSNTLVYVTITPYFLNGTVLSCTEESFTTNATTVIPECTALSFPLNGEIDIATSTDIYWNTIANASGYFLNIGTTPSATDILNNQDVGLTNNYDFTTDLPENTTVFITIIPYNSAGNAMSCAEESFTTISTCVIPVQPTTTCWETATFNTTTCLWEVTGTQDPMPTNLECWETAIFNNTTCLWEITGTQDPMPTNLECWETATFNTTTCLWEVTGTQDPMPTNLECWETASFNNTTCLWEVTGTQDPMPTNLECWETTSFNNTTCLWEVTGTQDPMPTNLECWETAIFNNTTCLWEVTGTQDPMPTNLECWETAIFNNTTCLWEITGTQDPMPTNLECWETASFNNTTCLWEITGTQDPMPTNLECWETASFNNTTCLWEVTGTQDPMPTNLECWETASFNNTTCLWEVTGTQDPMPTNLECWETAIFNNTTCLWEVSGTQDPMPTNLECWETTSFNNTTCLWEVTGTQDPMPTNLECWETASFNNTTCLWEVSGTQDPMPTNLECWETTSFNNTTCLWEVTGTQDPMPTNLECWETASFNNTTCLWEVSGTQDPMPTNLECWETASFNNTTCLWEVTGTQDPMPTNLECWETASFNNTTCLWEVTGTQPDPVDVLQNIAACDSFVLPILTTGNYFTASGGTGITMLSGDSITTSQTIYIYEANGTCVDESSFDVTIHPVIDFDLSLSNITIDAQSIVIDMTDLSIDYLFSVYGSNYQDSNQFIDLPDGTHTLYVTDVNGCVEKSISFEINNIQFTIPSVFTPNGDGYNDTWKIIDPKNEIQTIYVFDRYGKLLKTMGQNSQGWNGDFKNTKLITSDYWYLIELRNGKQLQGHFTLKR